MSTDRGDVTAPLIVDALGWRRVLGPGDNVQPPEAAALARPGGPPARASATTSSCGSTRATSTPATAGRSPRATSCASASAPSTRTTRSSSRRCGWSRTSTPAAATATRATGSRTGIRPATEDGVFFAGDSAGHCLPLTAEGIRTAFYFGIALGRELRAVLEGRQDKRGGAEALRRASAASTAGSTRRCTAAQQSIRHLHGRPLDNAGADLHPPHAWRTGRSSTTWRSRRRRSRFPRPPPRRCAQRRSKPAVAAHSYSVR